MRTGMTYRSHRLRIQLTSSSRRRMPRVSGPAAVSYLWFLSCRRPLLRVVTVAKTAGTAGSERHRQRLGCLPRLLLRRQQQQLQQPPPPAAAALRGLAPCQKPCWNLLQRQGLPREQRKPRRCRRQRFALRRLNVTRTISVLAPEVVSVHRNSVGSDRLMHESSNNDLAIFNNY